MSADLDPAAILARLRELYRLTDQDDPENDNPLSAADFIEEAGVFLGDDAAGVPACKCGDPDCFGCEGNDLEGPVWRLRLVVDRISGESRVPVLLTAGTIKLITEADGGEAYATDKAYRLFLAIVNN